jgi:hypothetical protein
VQYILLTPSAEILHEGRKEEDSIEVSGLGLGITVWDVSSPHSSSSPSQSFKLSLPILLTYKRKSLRQ